MEVEWLSASIVFGLSFAHGGRGKWSRAGERESPPVKSSSFFFFSYLNLIYFLTCDSKRKRFLNFKLGQKALLVHKCDKRGPRL